MACELFHNPSCQVFNLTLKLQFTVKQFIVALCDLVSI